MSHEVKKSLIVFLATGIALLATSYFIFVASDMAADQRAFWGNFLTDVAVVLVTVAFVAVLWEFLGGDPISGSVFELRSSVHLLLDSKETGIERVNPASSENQYGDTGWWMDRLTKARGGVDLMGYTLKIWTRGANFREEIITLVRKGVHVRFLIMDEENLNLTGFINEDQIRAYSVESTKLHIRAMSDLFKSIEEELGETNGHGSFQFKTCKKGMVTAQICRIDNGMTVIPYQYSVVTSQSPIFEIRGTEAKLFKSYSREFEMLWKLNEERPDSGAPS